MHLSHIDVFLFFLRGGGGGEREGGRKGVIQMYPMSLVSLLSKSLYNFFSSMASAIFKLLVEVYPN